MCRAAGRRAPRGYFRQVWNARAGRPFKGQSREVLRASPGGGAQWLWAPLSRGTCAPRACPFISRLYGKLCTIGSASSIARDIWRVFFCHSWIFHLPNIVFYSYRFVSKTFRFRVLELTVFSDETLLWIPTVTERWQHCYYQTRSGVRENICDAFFTSPTQKMYCTSSSCLNLFILLSVFGLWTAKYSAKNWSVKQTFTQDQFIFLHA